jgi:dihydrofolate reductase
MLPWASSGIRMSGSPGGNDQEVLMRRICYAVATSLDAYIAGPQGEFDWIVMDPEIDFAEIWSRYDTLLMGRRTFEIVQGRGETDTTSGMEIVVVSRTLRQQDHPNVTIVSDRLEEAVNGVRAKPGKDIWLFGGGELFRSLLDLGLVDTVEVAVMPVLVGGGIPLLAHPARQAKLRLTGSRVYNQTGIVSLEYAVEKGSH